MEDSSLTGLEMIMVKTSIVVRLWCVHVRGR